MNTIKKIITFVFILTMISCSNDSTSDLVAQTIVDNATYTNNVKSIIDANCISCHGSTPSNGAPMSLNTFENVKDAALNSDLIDRISRVQGEDGLMPNNGVRLPQNKIDIIIQWQANGYQQ